MPAPMSSPALLRPRDARAGWLRGGGRAARGLALSLLLAAGCDDGRDGPATFGAQAGPGAGAASAPASSAGAAPRRPGRRYYFERTPEGCEVYAEEDDARSPAEEARCPADLGLGERIRLTGKACMRESQADAGREVPVLCPDPLRELEKSELEARDAGG